MSCQNINSHKRNNTQCNTLSNLLNVRMSFLIIRHTSIILICSYTIGFIQYLLDVLLYIYIVTIKERFVALLGMTDTRKRYKKTFKMHIPVIS